MRHRYGVNETIALIFLSAIVFISCKETIEKTDALHALDSLSTQTAYDMKVYETTFGKISMRAEAPIMETYSLLPDPYEIFPQGIMVMTYTPEGLLETELTANMAIHKTKSNQERWEAYGNVVIINHIKEETITTDTLFYDIAEKRIYTHAFVKMISPQGLLQGYGLESDERANNFDILRPFDSFGVITRDTVAPAHSPPPLPSIL